MKFRKLTLSVLVVFMLSAVCAFADTAWDIELHWAKDAINTLMVNNMVGVYPDGRFKPDKELTREEAAQMLSYFVKGDANYQNSPGDVARNRWSYEYIMKVVSGNVMQCDGMGFFRPTDKITREDFAAILYSVLPEGGFSYKKTSNFSDISYSYAKKAITELDMMGVLGGYTENTFGPKQTITRAEAAAAVSNVCGLEIRPYRSTLPVSRVIDVPYISQLHPVRAVVGCEPTALLAGLKAKGYALNVGLREFLDNMPKTTQNPAKGFVGSPYVADKEKKTRTTIYPPILTEYAKGYGNVSDFSGSSLSELKAELLHGNPVVIYATMRWEAPYYRYYDIEGQQQYLLSNNHAVLLCGYDSETDYYYISDPYNIGREQEEYKYWLPASVVDPIYLERRHAITVE